MTAEEEQFLKKAVGHLPDDAVDRLSRTFWDGAALDKSDLEGWRQELLEALLKATRAENT